MPLSKGQIDRAGASLRQWWEGPSLPLSDVERSAVDVVWAYRRQFQYPLTQVNANLRHYVKKAGSDPPVISQRLKRLPRIVQKLSRYPRMRLTQMQDVGGCRAILPSQDAVEVVLTGISRRWDIVTVDDYVDTPKPDGYRGIHVIVRKSDVPIEVQLRTIGQQDWADEVERIDGLLTENIKDGEGSAEVREYLTLLSEVIRASEAAEPVEWPVADRLLRLRGRMP